MIKKFNYALIALMIAGTAYFSSCKKKETTPAPAPAPVVDSDQSGANANNLAESTSSDIESMGSEACDMAGNGSLGTFRPSGESLLSCAAVTKDTTNKIVTVTFNGSACIDGKVRSGSIIFNYSGSTNNAKRYRHPGFNLSVTTNSYVVDGNTVTATKNISNTTPVNFNPATTNETWSITANIVISLSAANGGGSVTWQCNRTKTLLNTATVYSNAATPINWPAARVGLEGTANGTRSNGETFTVTINSQLVRDFGACSISGKHPFILGNLTYAPSGKAARTVDYGSGTCDLNATVSISGNTYTVTLP